MSIIDAVPIGAREGRKPGIETLRRHRNTVHRNILGPQSPLNPLGKPFDVPRLHTVRKVHMADLVQGVHTSVSAASDHGGDQITITSQSDSKSFLE
jgi:hypothetical protein